MEQVQEGTGCWKTKVVTRFLERHHIPRASENGATRKNNTCEPRRQLPEGAVHRPYCRVVKLSFFVGARPLFLVTSGSSTSSDIFCPNTSCTSKCRRFRLPLRTPATFVTPATFASNGGIAACKSTRGAHGGVCSRMQQICISRSHHQRPSSPDRPTSLFFRSMASQEQEITTRCGQKAHTGSLAKAGNWNCTTRSWRAVHC